MGINKCADLRPACADMRIIENGLIRDQAALNCDQGGPEARNNHQVLLFVLYYINSFDFAVPENLFVNLKKSIDREFFLCYFYYDRHSTTDEGTPDVGMLIVVMPVVVTSDVGTSVMKTTDA